MLASMSDAVELGLVTKCNMIFGLPDQTKGDVMRTLGFVTRIAWLGVHDLGCYVFSPYPGSELYARLVAEGAIRVDADDYEHQLAQEVFTNYRLQRSWTPHLPAWSLAGLCFGTMAYFYAIQFLRRPGRAFALLQSLWQKRPRTYLQRMLIKKLRMPGTGGEVPKGTPATRAAAR